MNNPYDNREVKIIECSDGSIILEGVATGQWDLPTTFLLGEDNELLELPF